MKNVALRLTGASLAFMILHACSLHAPAVLNSKTAAAVDIRQNGVVAFEFVSQPDMEGYFWAVEEKTSQKHKMSFHGRNVVYAYELPPGSYTLKHFRIEGSEYGDSRAYSTNHETGAFLIEAGRITYIGSTTVSGEWAIPLVRKTRIELRTTDRAAFVDSVLKNDPSYHVGELPFAVQLAPADYKTP